MGAPHVLGRICSGSDSGTDIRIKQTSKTATAVASATTAGTP